MRLKLGPYKIGDTILLKCVASGGKIMINLSHDYLDMILQYYLMIVNRTNYMNIVNVLIKNVNITLNKSFVFI